MLRVIAGFVAAAALAAVSVSAAEAAVLKPGMVVPVRLFCLQAEPWLDMLALDGAGQGEAAGARFVQAVSDGMCFEVHPVVPGIAVEFIAEGETVSSGPVEIWFIQLPDMDGLAVGGFKSRGLLELLGDPS